MTRTIRMALRATALTLILMGACPCGAQQPEVLRYHVQEEGEVGQEVGNVFVDSGLSQDPGISQSGYLTFADGNLASEVDLFRIVNGRALEVARRIDRDSICQSRINCFINLDLQLQPSAFFRIIKIAIEVEDLDDHVPLFASPDAIRTISEAAVVGTRISLPVATDFDSPTFGISHYRIYMSPADSGVFELSIPSNVSGSGGDTTENGPDGPQFLILKKGLDRELQDSYRLELRAYDKGQPPKYGSTQLEIVVLDVNDNIPIFDNDTYHVTVSEDVGTMDSMIQVHASDRDLDDNARIRYEFDARTVSEFGTMFAIDGETGVVAITGHLDYETHPTISLLVTASNPDPGSPSNFATVRVSVLDTNDNAPTITIHGMDQAQRIYKLESTGNGNGDDGGFIAHVTVSDVDTSDGGKFSCALIGGFSDVALRKLFDTDYVIENTSPLDRETRPHYDVTIRCTDRGVPSRTSEQPLRIIIQDVNDNAPVFLQQSYTAAILENSGSHVTILQLSASDRDAGPNGKVQFRILEDEMEDFFILDGSSGELSTRVSLDREGMFARSEFHVVAYDSGAPKALSATATVIVDIEDVDDNGPTFQTAQESFWIFEGQSMKSYVGQLSATDPDSARFARFDYLIRYDGEDSEAFTVEPSSGKLYTSQVLDRELQDSYRFLVVAQPRTSGAKSGVASVIINVADVNDNTPEIQFPATYNNSVYIASDVSRGRHVTQILAADADTGTNAELHYSVVSGDPEGYFSLDPDTGVLTTTRDLYDLRDQVFGIVLSVQDRGSPPRGSESFLNIIVNKSLTAGPAGLMSKQNLTIVIVIGSLSGVIIVVLLVAIAVLLRWPHLLAACKGHTPGKYNQTPRGLPPTTRQHEQTHKQLHSNLDANLQGHSNQGFMMKDETNMANKKHGSCRDKTNQPANNNWSAANQRVESDWVASNSAGCSQSLKDSDVELSLAETDSGRGSHEDVGVLEPPPSHPHPRHPQPHPHPQPTAHGRSHAPPTHRPQPHPAKNQGVHHRTSDTSGNAASRPCEVHGPRPGVSGGGPAGGAPPVPGRVTRRQGGGDRPPHTGGSRRDAPATPAEGGYSIQNPTMSDEVTV